KSMDRQGAASLRPVLLREELLTIQNLANEIYVDDKIKKYIVELSHTTRAHKDIRIGASPRASFALMRGAQALALLRGRSYVIPDDVKALVLPIFAHRIRFEQHSRMAD